MTPLIFLDTETTGLDPRLHSIVEIAWAIGDGDVWSYVPAHTLEYATPQALSINDYFGRQLSSAQRTHPSWPIDLAKTLTGATIVGSNPAFDTAFLLRYLGYAPWHHRLINVAEGGMWVFRWDRPKGLADVAAELRQRGHDIPEPDHTATGDVRCTRAVYHALRAINGGAS